MFKRVLVRAVRLICEHEGDDPGNNLEVFGSLATAVGTVQRNRKFDKRQSQFLWQRDKAHYVSIAPARMDHVIDTDNSLQFDMSEGESILIEGILEEYDDTSANDH